MFWRKHRKDRAGSTTAEPSVVEKLAADWEDPDWADRRMRDRAIEKAATEGSPENVRREPLRDEGEGTRVEGDGWAGVVDADGVFVGHAQDDSALAEAMQQVYGLSIVKAHDIEIGVDPQSITVVEPETIEDLEPGSFVIRRFDGEEAARFGDDEDGFPSEDNFRTMLDEIIAQNAELLDRLKAYDEAESPDEDDLLAAGYLLQRPCGQTALEDARRHALSGLYERNRDFFAELVGHDTPTQDGEAPLAQGGVVEGALPITPITSHGCEFPGKAPAPKVEVDDEDPIDKIIRKATEAQTKADHEKKVQEVRERKTILAYLLDTGRAKTYRQAEDILRSANNFARREEYLERAMLHFAKAEGVISISYHGSSGRTYHPKSEPEGEFKVDDSPWAQSMRVTPEAYEQALRDVRAQQNPETD